MREFFSSVRTFWLSSSQSQTKPIHKSLIKSIPRVKSWISFSIYYSSHIIVESITFWLPKTTISKPWIISLERWDNSLPDIINSSKLIIFSISIVIVIIILSPSIIIITSSNRKFNTISYRAIRSISKNNLVLPIISKPDEICKILSSIIWSIKVNITRANIIIWAWSCRPVISVLLLHLYWKLSIIVLIFRIWVSLICGKIKIHPATSTHWTTSRFFYPYLTRGSIISTSTNIETCSSCFSIIKSSCKSEFSIFSKLQERREWFWALWTVKSITRSV